MYGARLEVTPMKRWQTYALGIGATLVGGLSASVAIGHQTASAAPSSPEAPPAPPGLSPIPVTGTVSANQAGAWNVGIVGTPSVNIANVPTVTLSNSSSLPLFFHNADDPGRVPYQTLNQLSSCPNPQECLATPPPVPAGHRLVVEHLSGNVQFNAVPQAISIVVSNQSGVTITGTRLAPPYITSTSFDIPVHFYVDGGQSYTLFAFVDPSTSFESNPNEPPATLNATGYLLDCTAAPCAPIAP